ncbi:SCO1664 family protein [Williamsia sp. CHRR-6]|uniref:SCO1664 family protein n=1 Tax=Williamsia sp. CHRR-6 TaxID=2835871 RepID=UPI0027DE2DFF|nr:SCO1664 family protein [Williamsia sp. CHRR-6]
MDGAAIAEVLEHGELELVGQVRGASNATLVCDAVYRDDVVRCVYKPVRGEQPLWDFPDGTLAGREVGSFLISDALRWSTIPTTVLRDGQFGPGMVQRWIDGPDDGHAGDDQAGDGDIDDGVAHGRLDLVDLCRSDAVPSGFHRVIEAYDSRGQEVTLVHADDPRLLRMAVLDVVINNADRKGGHILAGADGAVYGVDHGICLHREDKLRTVLWGWAGQPVPAELVADLEGLLARLTDRTGALRTRLQTLITTTEVAMLVERIRAIIDRPVMPTPDRSRPIPWPAF